MSVSHTFIKDGQHFTVLTHNTLPKHNAQFKIIVNHWLIYNGQVNFDGTWYLMFSDYWKPGAGKGTATSIQQVVLEVAEHIKRTLH